MSPLAFFGLLVSAFLGAFVGRAAARRQGFSTAAGAIVGFLLGIASPLMFLVSVNRPRQHLAGPTRVSTATPRQLLVYLLVIPGAIVLALVAWVLLATG